MPGFPDRFAPFYKRPPGTIVSSTASRLTGSVIRPLRRITQQYQNREPQWDKRGEVPSGWGHVPQPGALKKAVHFFYEKMREHGAETPGRTHPYERYRDGYEVPGVRPGESGARPEGERG